MRLCETECSVAAYQDNKTGGLFMIQSLHRVACIVLTANLVVACGDAELLQGVPLERKETAAGLVSAKQESCAMALTPLTDEDDNSNQALDRSIERYQTMATRAVEPRHALEALGWALVTKARHTRDAGYYRLAEQAAGCIEQYDAAAPEALLLRGHVLHNLHRFAGAEQIARQLTERRGLWFDYALLGDVLLERGALNEAVSAYQAVMAQRPGPQAYTRVAQLRWLKGDLDGAIEMLVDAARATSPRTPEAAAWVYVKLSRLLVQLGDTHAADSALVQALALQPGYAPALHARGRLHLMQDRVELAVELLQQAVQEDPQPEFRWSLYEALQSAGQHARAHEQRTALLQQGELEDPRTLAVFLATVGDQPERAVRLATRELALRADPFTLDAVAWALGALGEHERALEYSLRALAEGTQDARLFLHAGIIAARAGDQRRALTLLGKAESIQQMLLPSERNLLTQEFAVLGPRMPNLVDVHASDRESLVF